MPVFDLHTHLPAPKPAAIISCSPADLPDSEAFPGQLYSVGFHPWNLPPIGLSEADITLLHAAASRSDVVAVGECGIDLAHPGAAPLYAQLLALKTHIDISERLCKPLILHCVKSWDTLIALRKEYRPAQRWIVHGFRGKPSILNMLLRAGIDVSYGEKFNPESLALTPPEKLFAETDESHLPISEIIALLNVVNPDASENRIAANIRELLAL